jgi:hypothetical protein
LAEKKKSQNAGETGFARPTQEAAGANNAAGRASAVLLQDTSVCLPAGLSVCNNSMFLKMVCLLYKYMSTNTQEDGHRLFGAVILTLVASAPCFAQGTWVDARVSLVID